MVGLTDQLSAKPLFLIIFQVYNIIRAHLQSLGKFRPQLAKLEIV